MKGVRSGVERRRGRGLKARDPGRRDTPGKVLKDRRSPRRRGRMGTSVWDAPERARRGSRRCLSASPGSDASSSPAAARSALVGEARGSVVSAEMARGGARDDEGPRRGRAISAEVRFTSSPSTRRASLTALAAAALRARSGHDCSADCVAMFNAATSADARRGRPGGASRNKWISKTTNFSLTFHVRGLTSSQPIEPRF